MIRAVHSQMLMLLNRQLQAAAFALLELSVIVAVTVVVTVLVSAAAHALILPLLGFGRQGKLGGLLLHLLLARLAHHDH